MDIPDDCGSALAAVGAQKDKPLILHISCDYPNPHRDATTTAVERLVRGTGGVRHLVISLNRTSNPLKNQWIDCGEENGVRLIAFRYFSPPLGVGLSFFMRLAAKKIARFLDGENIRPDVVHAHKFAFEGIAALALLERWSDDSIRFFVSIRAEAESKIFKYKPHYRALLQRIADRATRIYFVSAWFQGEFNRLLRVDPAKEVLLPNIVGNTSQTPCAEAPSRRFVCVVNLDTWRRKALPELISGFASFIREYPGYHLDIIGGGSVESRRVIERAIKRVGAQECVHLLGAMSNAEVTERLPSYLGLALASRNETFGMVYLEALFAGVPILYGKETGIDGHLRGLNVGVAVTPGDVAEISAGFSRLLAENADFRAAIRAGAQTLHHRFDAANVLALYRGDIFSGWRNAS